MLIPSGIEWILRLAVSSSERARKGKDVSRDASTAGMRVRLVIHLLYAAAEDWLQVWSVYWDGRVRADRLAGPVSGDYWLQRLVYAHC
jgi:hypothetical protein